MFVCLCGAASIGTWALGDLRREDLQWMLVPLYRGDRVSLPPRAALCNNDGEWTYTDAQIFGAALTGVLWCHGGSVRSAILRLRYAALSALPGCDRSIYYQREALHRALARPTRTCGRALGGGSSRAGERRGRQADTRLVGGGSR